MQMPLFMANKQNCRRINISNQQQQKHQHQHFIYKLLTPNLQTENNHNKKLASKKKIIIKLLQHKETYIRITKKKSDNCFLTKKNPHMIKREKSCIYLSEKIAVICNIYGGI